MSIREPLTIRVDSESIVLPPAERPTLYFIGVSTGGSSIRTVFPRWAEQLGLHDVELVGLDLPLHAEAALHRKVVEFIRDDPHSRGALVTTHKIDLYNAASDLFDVIDEHARTMGEVSCISKSDGHLICHAKDPLSSGLALESFVSRGHWEDSRGELLCLGAGGSTIAITWFLSQRSRGADRPRRMVITNRSEPRLEHIRAVHTQLGVEIPVEYVLAADPETNSRVMSALGPGSLVVNATGLGKDGPGSPITDEALFPESGLAWELNYRGELLFREQARRQEKTRGLHVEDGWTYFLHGWTQVISEVFHIDIPTQGPAFDALSSLARAAR